MIESVQILRALSALAITAVHYELFYCMAFNACGAGYTFAFAECAVDLFFVISGFIMVYASRSLFAKPDAVSTFMVRRFTRVIPLYWIVTGAYLLAAVYMPLFGKDYSPAFIISSFLFFPYPRPEGAIQPLVGQGWTLNYEILFYVIFGACVWLPRRWAVLVASVIVMAFVIAGMLFDFQNPALKFWTNAIMIDFVFGMIIGLAFTEGVRWPRWSGYALIAAGLALSGFSAILHDATGGRFTWSLGTAALVAGATLGQWSARGMIARAAVVIGEASFSLYLIHAIVARGAVYVLKFMNEQAFWSGLLVTLVISSVVAVAIFYLFEAPMHRYLLKVTHQRRPTLDAPPVKP